MTRSLPKGFFELAVACVCPALVCVIPTANAGIIHCDVYQNVAPYTWTVAGSFDTDAIDFPAGWQPYGLSTWKATFQAPITVSGVGGQGFWYLQSGFYTNFGIGAYPFQGIGASGSIPGVVPAVMARSDGWNLAPGVYTFQFSVDNDFGYPAGAIVNWDPGVSYGVPEPATALLLMIGVLIFGCPATQGNHGATASRHSSLFSQSIAIRAVGPAHGNG